LLRRTGSLGVGTAVCQVYRKNTRTHIWAHGYAYIYTFEYMCLFPRAYCRGCTPCIAQVAYLRCCIEFYYMISCRVVDNELTSLASYCRHMHRAFQPLRTNSSRVHVHIRLDMYVEVA
jgi:hypothetical protein